MYLRGNQRIREDDDASGEEGSELDHMRLIARRARFDILRAGEGGDAMSAALEQMRGEEEEQVGAEAVGQAPVDMVAGEQGGGEEQPELAGDTSEDEERTDRDVGDEDPEDGDQVRGHELVRR